MPWHVLLYLLIRSCFLKVLKCNQITWGTGAYLTMLMNSKLLFFSIQKVTWPLSNLWEAPGVVGMWGSLPAGHRVRGSTQAGLLWASWWSRGTEGVPVPPFLNPKTRRKPQLLQKCFLMLLCNFINFQMHCTQTKQNIFLIYNCCSMRWWPVFCAIKWHIEICRQFSLWTYCTGISINDSIKDSFHNPH